LEDDAAGFTGGRALGATCTPASSIGGALATIYALTLLCGLYPSWLASRVQPAAALHYE